MSEATPIEAKVVAYLVGDLVERLFDVGGAFTNIQLSKSSKVEIESATGWVQPPSSRGHAWSRVQHWLSGVGV